MPRARNIKPSIMDNEDLAELEPLDRLLFIYLWMLADREGRVEDRPKRIAKQALAYDRTADIDAILGRLVGGGFVRRYTAAGVPVLLIANFLKHQKPHGTEKDSELPDENGFLTVHERAYNGYSTGSTRAVPYALTVKTECPTDEPNSSVTVKPGGSSGVDNALIPDSGFLIPDSLIPDSNTPLPPKGGVRRSRFDPDEEPEGFAAWYALYRRKDAKRDAIKAWRQLGPDEVLQARMMSALVSWKWNEDRTKNPLPASWIRGGRWEDESVRKAPAGGGATPPWVLEAGFQHMAEAQNAGCHIGNYRDFRDGQRMETIPA